MIDRWLVIVLASVCNFSSSSLETKSHKNFLFVCYFCVFSLSCFDISPLAGDGVRATNDGERFLLIISGQSRGRAASI